MRKINVLTFVSLDGVMQAPGGPEEDTSGGFRHGGWLPGYFDEALGREMGKELGHKFDLLLGRRTYDIFASYWPKAKGSDGAPINKATKYVATHHPLSTDWNKTAVPLKGDAVEAIRKLKKGSGPELQVHGSGVLIQSLLKNDLVDELWLKIFPVTIGSGRRLFEEGTAFAGWSLVESSTTPSGVIIAKYQRAGKPKSGSIPPPT